MSQWDIQMRFGGRPGPFFTPGGLPEYRKRRRIHAVMMGIKVIALLAVLLVPSVALCADYVIGEGDALAVSVWGSKELSLSVRVRPDGKITIPSLGDVAASGLTPVQLQDSLTEKLKRVVRNPVVTVIVEEIHNNKVYLFGGGVRPGVYDLNRRTTLLQLLCLIKEFNNPDLRRAYLLRNGTKIKEDFYPLFIKGVVEEDVVIKPDDSIFIPALNDKNVYVVGEVNTPKFVEYREGLKVMEAILEAGGFTKFAKENKTVVLRKEGDREVSIRIKLKDLIEEGDLSQNISLKPGDYVDVKEGVF